MLFRSPQVWDRLADGRLAVELRVIYTKTPEITPIDVLPFDMPTSVLAELTTRVTTHLHP